MTKYYVEYYYLATGMEGIADVKSYGMVEADNKDEAVEKVVMKEYPDNYKSEYNEDLDYLRRFFSGCLTAKEI